MDEVKNTETTGVAVEDSSSGSTGSDQAQVADPVDQLAAIAAERDRLAEEKAELQDRILRRQAEFDNFRKRVERERFETLEYASMEAIKSILPIVDDFQRALKTECADKEYVRGMELIEQRFTEAMTKLGLVPMESLDKKFDPNLHHAVSKQPSDNHEEETIIEEYQKGYFFKDRLLRPAMVKVAVRP